MRKRFKECPFCGGKTCVLHDAVETGGQRWVVCLSCGAEGPYKRTKSGAVRAWNKRAGEVSRRGAETRRERVGGLSAEGRTRAKPGAKINERG